MASVNIPQQMMDQLPSDVKDRIVALNQMRRSAGALIANSFFKGLGGDQIAIQELTEEGWAPEKANARISQGPFQFGWNLAAATPIPANSTAAGLDLTNPVPGPPANGPLSLGLFGNYTPTNTKPFTMLFASSFMLEVSAESTVGGGITEDQLLAILESLTLYWSYKAGNESVNRYIELGAGGGTVSAGGVAAAVPAAGPGATRSARRAVALTSHIPIYLATDILQLQTNAQAIPNIPVAVRGRLVVNGYAVQNVQDPNTLRTPKWGSDCGDEGRIPTSIGRLTARLLRQAMGTGHRQLPSIVPGGQS